MANVDDIEETIAVVGETVSLRFEADEHFAGSVDVSFSVLTLDGAPRDPGRRSAFSTLFRRTIQAAPGPDAPSGRKSSLLRWVVELPHRDLEERLCLIAFEASGRTARGRRLIVRSSNRLRVPGIAITQNPALHALMLHEFAQRDGNSFLLDRQPLRDRLSNLTIQQRKLLATYETAAHRDRLVVFVTLEPGTHRPMFADNCSDVPTSVHANASFTVFACHGQGELVELVCHTNHFVINTINPDTGKLFRSWQASHSPDAWLSPANPNPPKFLCGSTISDKTDGVVWSRLFTTRGVDVMPGNSIHGILNTQGCWMLFRNYNWPVQIRTKLHRTYARWRAGSADLTNELPAVGHDDPLSVDKFLYFDLNYAYNFFFRDLVGIEFFAGESQFYFRYANLHNTHGLVFENSFDFANVLRDRFLYHDIVKRRESDPNFAASDALFTNNVLGFRTCTGFIPAKLWRQNISVNMVNERSWSDFYFYKPVSYPLSAALKRPVEIVR